MRELDRIASTGGGSWDLYKEDGVSVVAVEIGNAGHPYERALIREELKELMKAAVRGELDPYEEVKPIALRPGMYELRLDTETELIWRLYFVWKGHLGPLRVALKFGGKPGGPMGLQVQDRHIVEAWERYKSWQRSKTS